MAQTTNLISNNFPGYGLLEGRWLPCSGVSGRVVALSSSSSLSDQRIYWHVKSGSLKCTQGRVLNVCNATSSGHRRNPDFSRQNRNGFRGRNRPNEDRDSFESPQESDMLSSKNGPLLSLSSSPKFQATAAPGPREKEIVELFRKVQAQLRERAAVKEDKKIEASQGQGKASETVDSLLKLLRKHSVEQGKRKGSSTSSSDLNSYEFEKQGEYSEDRRKHSVEQGMRKDNTTGSLDKNSYQPNKQNGKYNEDKSISYPDSRSNVRDDAPESKPSTLARPPSSFRRRSPVRQVKFHPSSRDNVVNSAYSSVQVKKHLVEAVPEYEAAPESEQEPKPEPELELEPQSLYEDKDILDDVSLDLEDSDDEDEKEEKHILDEDLSAMKLSELRALAKSRGLKGYSKMKKGDLLELLAVS